MQFNTFPYIFAFLPISIIGWFVFNKFSNLAAKIFLIVISLAFYGYAGLKGLACLLLSMIVNYAIVLILKKNNGKIALCGGITFNIVNFPRGLY